MKRFLGLWIVLYWAVLYGDAYADTYYVSLNGNDANPGTLARPWRTLQKAASTPVAGDTVYIIAGTYGERLVPENSGTAGAYITYTTLPGDTATIDGAALVVPPYAGLVDLAGRSYIRISGLRVVNSNEAGILADGTSHIIIEGNSLYNTASSAIGVWSSADVLVSNNRVDLACTNGSQECISVAGTDSFEVRDNLVINCKKEGICPKDGSSNGLIHRNHVHHTEHVGIYVDAWDKHTHDIDVYGNLVHDIVQKDGIMLASEQGGLLENVRVYNNISHTNGFSGIGISACCPGAANHPIRNIIIVNNTLYGNGVSGWGGGIGVGNNPDLDRIIIRNNICSQNLTFQIAIDSIVPSSSITVDHNLIDGFQGVEGEVRGIEFVEADPQFVDPSALDFHLLKTSPAINTGSMQLAPLQDYDGNARPSGAAIDIGCFEYSSSTSADNRIQEDVQQMHLEQNYPNPFTRSTAMSYRLSIRGHVRLEVFDVLGRKLATLVDAEKEAGEHVSTFDIRHSIFDVPPGIYIYQIHVGTQRASRSMVILR